MSFQESGISGIWDFGKLGFQENGILSKRDLGKLEFGKKGFWGKRNLKNKQQKDLKLIYFLSLDTENVHNFSFNL